MLLPITAQTVTVDVSSTVISLIPTGLLRDPAELHGAPGTLRDLQEVAMSLRMVTLKATFQKMSRLVRDVSIKAGKRVAVPVYDFKTHRRTDEPRWLEPKPVVIVEGILALVDARLRAELDIKIFVDTDPDIRIFRRIRRDIEQRGRTFESVREQYYRHVRPMHLQFVEPSKRRADLIIPEGGDNRVALDLVVSKLRNIIDRAREAR